MHVAMLKSSAANEQMSKKKGKRCREHGLYVDELIETAIRLLLMLLVAYSK